MHSLIRIKVVSSCHYPPVATSALLAYEICIPLHPDVALSCGFLCVMGTYGDLGRLCWRYPFPEMTKVFEANTEKEFSKATALINARKRLHIANDMNLTGFSTGNL